MNGRTVEAVWGGLPVVLLVTALGVVLWLWRAGPLGRRPSRLLLATLASAWSGAVSVVVGVPAWNPGLWAHPLRPHGVRPWSLRPLRALGGALGGTSVSTGMWEQMGGNLLLLAPLAVLVPLLTGARPSVARAALYAAGTSLGLELLQLAGRFGIADVDDVLLNTAGAVVAYASLRLGERLLSRPRRSASWRPSPPRTP